MRCVALFYGATLTGSGRAFAAIPFASLWSQNGIYATIPRAGYFL
tara:strand:+ start:6901 stop:7035 length:135 start_codon:yes stop_codon:yes gene_type:complete